MLFFTLLSAWWTNMDWGKSFFVVFASSSIPDVPGCCTSMNKIYTLRNTFSFFFFLNNDGSFLMWGEGCGFEKIHHCRKTGSYKLHKWFRFSGPVLVVRLFFTDVEPVQVSTNGFVKTERHVWVGRSTAVKRPWETLAFPRRWWSDVRGTADNSFH